MVQYVNILPMFYLSVNSGAHYVAAGHQPHTALCNENKHYLRYL